MWPRSADARAEAFGRYWDALAGGAPADETARLREGADPTLIAATERVRTDHRPRQADPAFVARLERDLMQTLDAAYAGSRPLRPGQTHPSAGAGRLSPVRAAGTDYRARRVPARAGYAAAAVLIAAALALAIRPWEDGQRAALPPALPAPTAAATPATTPASGTIELRATATGLPDGPSWVGIARDTFTPGTDITFDCRGADLLIVESGTLLVTTDRPARVTRAGGSAAEVPASTEVTLAAGDGIAVEGPTALRLRNPGSAPAVAIESGIEVDNGTAEGGYTYVILAAQENAPLRYPAAITLRRVTLSPGETAPSPPAGALQLAAAASPDGLLASTDNGDRNVGRAPLAVYVYTIAFPPEASPVATPAQVATPAEAEAQLLSLALPAWEGPAWVLVEVTVPANVASVTDDGTCCRGALVDYVLAGRERLRSDGPLRVARAGNPGAWEDLPAGSEVTLGPGDARRCGAASSPGRSRTAAPSCGCSSSWPPPRRRAPSDGTGAATLGRSPRPPAKRAR